MTTQLKVHVCVLTLFISDFFFYFPMREVNETIVENSIRRAENFSKTNLF